MIVTTMNDIPGYAVDDVFGEVMGLTVRSRNLGSQIGAGLKVDRRRRAQGMTTEICASGRGTRAQSLSSGVCNSHVRCLTPGGGRFSRRARLEAMQCLFRPCQVSDT
jgi:hypothetical protein